MCSSSLSIVNTPSNSDVQTCDAINWHRSNSLCIRNKRPFGRKQNCFSVMRSDWYIDSWFRNWQRKVKTWSSGGLWCLVQTELRTLMFFRWRSLPAALSCTTQQCTELTAEGKTYRVLSLPSGTPTPAHARDRVGEPTGNDNPVLSDKIMTPYVTIQFLLLSKHTPSSLQKPYIWRWLWWES